jgi:hypothetical protein
LSVYDCLTGLLRVPDVTLKDHAFLDKLLALRRGERSNERDLADFSLFLNGSSCTSLISDLRARRRGWLGRLSISSCSRPRIVKLSARGQLPDEFLYRLESE